MSGIFICYRREDGGAHAGRLYDRLSAHFGRELIFMDIDTIEPGSDFVEVINDKVGSCDVLIAVIGRKWVADEEGRRRLDNPEDFIRLEISAALTRKIRVIPVLVGGSTMTHSKDLPHDFAQLARRQALEISDTRFHHDVDRLIEALEKAIAAVQGQSKITEEPQLLRRDKAEAERAAENESAGPAQAKEEMQSMLYRPSQVYTSSPSDIAPPAESARTTSNEKASKDVHRDPEGAQSQRIKKNSWIKVGRTPFSPRVVLLVLVGTVAIAVARYAWINWLKAPAQEDQSQVYLDSRTGLLWTKSDNGRDLDWSQANEYCQNLRLGDYSNWRLPTIDQLENLYDPRGEPKIRKPIRVTGGFGMWSSNKEGSDSAWVFNFVNGVRNSYRMAYSSGGRALCVRRTGE